MWNNQLTDEPAAIKIGLEAAAESLPFWGPHHRHRAGKYVCPEVATHCVKDTREETGEEVKVVFASIVLLRHFISA